MSNNVRMMEECIRLLIKVIGERLLVIGSLEFEEIRQTVNLKLETKDYFSPSTYYL